MTLSKEIPELHLMRHVFETEARVSKSETDHLPGEIRNAVLAATKLARFYHENRTDMIMPRDTTQILRQMASQIVFTFEIPHNGENDVVAAGILWDREWPVIEADASIRVEQFLEAGTQQCILNGYNLQWSINAFTLLRALFYDPIGTYFTATYGDNDPSIGNFINKMKFGGWPDIPTTIARWRLHDLEQHNEDQRGIEWFRPNYQTVVAAAERVVDFVENPIRTAKSGSEPLHPQTKEPLEAVKFVCEGKIINPIYKSAREICEKNPSSYSELLEIESLQNLPEGFISPV